MSLTPQIATPSDECFLEEVHSACCDEGGRNCEEGRAVPDTCPVGCAIV